jgi:hypothetical protein
MENNYRMSPSGFWVPVRESRESEDEASGPSVEGFGEAGTQFAAPGADVSGSVAPPSERGMANAYRMSELGLWVPVGEVRDWEKQASSPPIEDFREGRRQFAAPGTDASGSVAPDDEATRHAATDDEAREASYLKGLRRMRRYLTDPIDPTLPLHVQKGLRRIEDYVCQDLDREIRKLERKAKLRKYREAGGEAHLEKFRAWVEEEHPRDEFGRFTDKELERRAWWQRKWLAEAAQFLAQRERSGFRQFFGADMHGPPTPEEEQLRRKAAVVMDTKNWILDESGNLHSVAGLAAKGLSRPRYTGPAMRAMTPDDKEAFARNAQQRKELERDEAWRSTFQKTLLNANPTFPADWNMLELVRLRQEAEDADRLLSMSVGQRLGLHALEWLIWELAIGGAGQFVGAARLGGGVPNPERALNFLKKNPKAVEEALARNFESQVGKSISAAERAQLDAAWKKLLPEVETSLTKQVAGVPRPPNPFIKGKIPLLGTRDTGVRRATALEIDMVQRTGKGTLDWTAEEIAYIKRNGRLPEDIVGHHINNVAQFPEWAGDPRNVKFVRGQRGNLDQHGGNFRNPTMGPLIDRHVLFLELLEGDH